MNIRQNLFLQITRRMQQVDVKALAPLTSKLACTSRAAEKMEYDGIHAAPD